MKTKMRTLRKAVCVGLAVCLLVSTFAGCGKKEAKAPSAKTGSMEDVAENQTETCEVYDSMKANSGVMVYMGGAAILETKAHKGAFAIAFAEGFEKEEKALELFNAMTEE
ncbi:MAG: hypothetical protein HFI64_12855 [Lachnospiraceae bacterium]|nr:hypothetical protein [Lachnospiraceae bacterium]